MSPSIDDEQVLNVFREHLPENKTLTTEDLAEELPIKQRTAQNYVNDLEKGDHLVLESEGKPNHWRLADSEPVEPVYDTRLAKAKRRGNKAAKVGQMMFLVGVSTLAVVGLVTSNHFFAQAFDISLPLINTSAASSAIVIGVFGSIIFGGSFVAFLVSVALPRAVEWYTDGPLPDEP